MKSTTATQLETLRNNCFPDVPAVPRPPAAVPAVPVARPPVAPAVHRPPAEPAEPARSSTFSSLKKSTTRIVVDLDTSDDDIVQPVPKRLKVDNQLPFVAAPQMPVLDGYASNSGGSFRDDFDDVASVTDSIESVGGIETPTGSPPSPFLPHAPDPEVVLHFCHIGFAMFELDHCFQTILVLNPGFLANNKLLLKFPKANHESMQQ